MSNRFILITIVAILLACGGAARSSPTDDDPMSFNAICQEARELTDAQFERRAAELAGQRVQWTGDIIEVQPHAGAYQVLVTMGRAPRDVTLEQISEEVALNLNKGQKINFSGDIRFISNVCLVALQSVTIE